LVKSRKEWKVEGEKMLVSGLGPIPDCSEIVPLEEEKYPINHCQERSEGDRRILILQPPLTHCG